MNSTDAHPSPDSRKVFERCILPLSVVMKRDGREAFPRKPDATAPSYYTTRSKKVMSREDFEIPALRDASELEPELRKFWEARGEPELAAMAAELAGLAIALRKAEAAAAGDGGEVSPFRYVMF